MLHVAMKCSIFFDIATIAELYDISAIFLDSMYSVALFIDQISIDAFCVRIQVAYMARISQEILTTFVDLITFPCSHERK